MNRVTPKDVRKLVGYPLDFAMIMENSEIEHVIVAFVSALNSDKTKRGDQN